MASSNTRGRLLLVIPTVLEESDGRILVDGDFANNLSAYLRAFDEVCVMSPAMRTRNSFPSVCEVGAIHGHERLELIVLPNVYREDRYLRLKRRVAALLRREIERSDYILVSPHAAFDWSTLAAEICIDLNAPYNMEADWNLPEVTRYMWSRMPFGVNKLRKYFWRKYHDRKYYRVLRHSSLSLLQGGDVYNDLSKIAPNAFSVLNVQVTDDEHISPERLERKVAGIAPGNVVKLVYTGRAIDIKGPQSWLAVIEQLQRSGCAFEAIWAGDGERLDEMRKFVADRGLGDCCKLVGKIERGAARELIAEADIFLFCHMTKESPRCLVEALANGTPIVGFGTDYSRDLVKSAGGGLFVERGDVDGLARAVETLLNDPARLRELILAAAASGRLLERESAIQERIDLMKQHLPRRPLASPAGNRKRL